jgi:hypothetical protein
MTENLIRHISMDYSIQFSLNKFVMNIFLPLLHQAKVYKLFVGKRIHPRIIFAKDL